MARPTVDLELVRAFVAVHDGGSFSAAAARLGVPRSTVSRAVAALEESLGLLLFHRTTRKVATTAAGVALYDRVAPSLGSLDAALSDLPDKEEAPAGLLRITTTPDLGTVIVAEAVTRYLARYPETQVEMLLGAGVRDLVRDGIDLALRISTGPPRDSSLIARKVGEIVFRLYGAPSYLARRGTPRRPADLRDHDWVSFQGGAPMRLSSPRTQSPVEARTRVFCDDMFFAREALRTGAGIGALPSFVADGDLADGRLVHLLPRWTAITGTVSLILPSRKHTPGRVTAFRDLLLELLRQRPLSGRDSG
jgi:DNA-binding transcriptional LysR family regulator